jgi:hypothetical protein
MQVLCSTVANDFGVRISGAPEQVQFTVSASPQVSVQVDWDITTGSGYSMVDVLASGALNLLRAVTSGVQVGGVSSAFERFFFVCFRTVRRVTNIRMQLCPLAYYCILRSMLLLYVTLGVV